MLLTFCLKNKRSWPLVASEWEVEGGLRRRLIVEKRCLELPGLLLMIEE
jgi:hypothetical protein